MRDDLISREAALNATKMVYIECLYMDEKEYEECMADDLAVVFASDIKKIPAVDAVPVVHGLWIRTSNNPLVNKFTCSVCGNDSMKGNYCPNCGAKMGGGNDGTDD